MSFYRSRSTKPRFDKEASKGSVSTQKSGRRSDFGGGAKTQTRSRRYKKNPLQEDYLFPDKAEDPSPPQATEKQFFSFFSELPEPIDPAFTYQPSLIILVCFSSGIVLDRFLSFPGLLFWLSGLLLSLSFWGSTVYFCRRTFFARRDSGYSFVYGPARKPYPPPWYAPLFERVPFSAAVGSVFLCGALVCSGGCWHQFYWNWYSPSDLSVYCTLQPQICCVRGVVSSPLSLIEAQSGFSPLPQSDKTAFDLDLRALRDRWDWISVSGTARVSVRGQLTDVHVGDLVEIVGQMALPAGPDAPGNFDYRNYLRGKRILSVVFASFPTSVRGLGQEKASYFGARILEYFQENARNNLYKRIHSRQARLASAILLGNRSELAPEMLERFQETGTIHILVVSGLHVSMLSVLLTLVLSPLPLGKMGRVILVACLVLVYVAITGWQAPAVRAGVLSAIGAMAYLGNRKILSYNVLGTAGIIVLLYNPSDLFNAGTQLSFLTVAAIVTFTPFIISVTSRFFPEPWKPQTHLALSLMREGWRKRLILLTRGKTDKQDAAWVPVVRWLSRGVVGSVMLSVLVLAVIAPLVATRFHVLSFFSVFLNLLLWIPVFVSVASGMITMFAGAFDHSWTFTWISQLSGFVCERSLWFMEATVQTVHGWRWGRIWTCGLSEWALGSFYLILAGWTFVPYLRQRPARMGAILAVWASLAAAIPLWNQLTRPERVEIDFVNVGHGGCTVIQMPNGHTILFDCGQMTNPRYGAQTVSCLLWNRGITRIQAAVISHADADHYNMLPDLAERFALDTIYVSSCMFTEKENELLSRFRLFLEQANVNVKQVKKGDLLWSFPGWEMQALHPDEFGVTDPVSVENANSLVFSLKYGRKRILLSGDISGNGLRELVKNRNEAAFDVVQAPHHGASDCNTDEFIAWSHPKNVIIPESAVNPQKKVCERYRRAGAGPFHLGQCGTVHFVLEK